MNIDIIVQFIRCVFFVVAVIVVAVGWPLPLNKYRRSKFVTGSQHISWLIIATKCIEMMRTNVFYTDVIMISHLWFWVCVSVFCFVLLALCHGITDKQCRFILIFLWYIEWIAVSSSSISMYSNSFVGIVDRSLHNFWNSIPIPR